MTIAGIVAGGLHIIAISSEIASFRNAGLLTVEDGILSAEERQDII